MNTQHTNKNHLGSASVAANRPSQSNETDPPPISAERQRILLGFGSPQSPAEREFQIQYAERCGLSGPMTFPKLQDDNDYEGAILARQEADGIYD